MSRSITDARQVTLRQFLSQIGNASTYAGTADAKPANQAEVDNLLVAINDELTQLLRMSASSTPDRVVTIGSGTLVNSESSRTRSIPTIAGLLPAFTSGTVTFPAASGGTITVSPGNNGTLTVSSGNYIKVLIYLDSSGNLNVSSGIQNATEASATVPHSPIDTLPLGYVTLQNVAGTIQDIVQGKIYQFDVGTGVTNTGLDSEFVIKDSTDPTKQIGFDAAGTTGTKTTIVSSQTTNKTLTLPDATDTLVGKATTDILSNKQVQYSSTTDSTTTGSNSSLQAFSTGIVRLTNASLVSLSGIPAGSSGQFLIIENKTGNQISINNEEATATAANRIQTGNSSNVSMPNNATFAFTYDSTSSRWQLTGGSGSGSGSGSGKNYLSAIATSQSATPNTGNGNFESGSTTGWSLFNTTLTSLIPTGSITAGAASVTTFNTVSSGQLAGGYSLQTASSGAWAAGAGFISDSFYIDTEDQAKVLTFKAYYKAVTNPTNGNFSGTSSNTFAVYVYDVTNSAWIQPAGVYGITQNAGVGYVTGSFQTTSNSTQYRLAVVAVNASAGAITMYWDDFSVGPQTAPIGAAITDWAPKTMTLTNAGNATVSAAMSKVGDTAWFRGTITIGSSLPTGTIALNMPSGMTIDTSKSAGLTHGIAGASNSGGTGSYTGQVRIDTSSSVIFYGDSNAGAWNATVPRTFAAADRIDFLFPVAISGWSSNVQMSNDTDTRVVSAKMQKSGTQAFSSETKITSWTVTNDTSGMWNAASNRFNINVSGDYIMNLNIYTNAAGSVTVIPAYKINGGGTTYFGTGITASGDIRIGGSVLLPNLKAGDYVEAYEYTTGSQTIQSADWSLHRLSGPSVIAASESVGATYTVDSGGQSLTSNVPVQFNTKVFDTHNAMTTGSSCKYTAPISGKYLLHCNVFSANNSSGQFQLSIRKNGSTINRLEALSGFSPPSSISTNQCLQVGTIILPLNTGDILDIFILTAAIAGNIYTVSTDSWFSIERIGN